MSKKALKVFFFCIFIVSYINIGNVYNKKIEEIHYQIAVFHEDVDINFENGILAGPWLMVAGNGKEQTIHPFFCFTLWPFIILTNILTWTVWFLFLGGILEGPYTIPLILILVVSGYFFLRLFRKE